MATRPVWAGTLAFALINIPVKLHKASRDAAVHFKNLHTICQTPINMRKWCAACGKEVSQADLNKGYEIEKGKFVILTEKEIEAAAPEESKAIKVENVVDASEIPMIALDNFYYLVPSDKSSNHAYALLTKALETKRQALIGRFVMRTREHLCYIQAWNHGLLLTALRWQDELNGIAPLILDVLKEEIPEEELALANMLLERLHTTFKYEDCCDTYREKIHSLIDRKAKGETITPAIEIQQATPKDIMAELRKSIQMIAT